MGGALGRHGSGTTLIRAPGRSGKALPAVQSRATSRRLASSLPEWIEPQLTELVSEPPAAAGAVSQQYPVIHETLQ